MVRLVLQVGSPLLMFSSQLVAFIFATSSAGGGEYLTDWPIHPMRLNSDIITTSVNSPFLTDKGLRPIFNRFIISLPSMVCLALDIQFVNLVSIQAVLQIDS